MDLKETDVVGEKMKTIYICSEYFAPYQNVGSIKFTKIAKYLSRNKEYRIFIFTRKNFSKIDRLLEDDLCQIKENGGKVYYIDAGKRYYQAPGKLYRKVYPVWYRLSGYNLNYYLSSIVSAKRFVKIASGIVAEKHLPKPDYILSTYDDWGGHYFAMALKEKWKDKTVWISDFRDPVGGAVRKGVFRKLCDRFSRQVTEQSDYTTLVSEGLLHNIKMHSGAKPLIATNGFDYEDYQRVSEDKKKLHLIYTGSFYHKNMTLIPVFRAIRELLDEGKIEEKYISIEYAGAYSTKVYGEICRHGLEKCYSDWGEVSRYQSILIQDRADILMTSVWNSKEAQGVLAGKTVGYLMMKKPIIAIVGGTLGNSNMKKFIQEINGGICYEEAEQGTDYLRLKQAIIDYYTQKSETGSVVQNFSSEVEKYNLEYVAGLYEKIMKDGNMEGPLKR